MKCVSCGYKPKTHCAMMISNWKCDKCKTGGNSN